MGKGKKGTSQTKPKTFITAPGVYQSIADVTVAYHERGYKEVNVRPLGGRSFEVTVFDHFEKDPYER